MKKEKRQPHDFSELQQREIAQQIKEHTEAKAENDFTRFQIAVQTHLDTIKPLSPIGLTFIEHFVHTELLNTFSKHGISFYDFWWNREFYMNRDDATKKLILSIQKNKPYLSYIKIAKQVFNLYYGGISIFRPTHAARLYHKYNPTAILDFTMGWGGRLLGAAVLSVPKYIGIDSNLNLKVPYYKMTSFLKEKTNMITQMQLYFQDALTVDYSTLDYDMVFTSPPYYNKELYKETTTQWNTKKTQEEWNETFYKPLFQKTWTHLKPGGHYCLNIPSHLYANICVPIFGEATEAIALKKYNRILPKKEQKQFNVGQGYEEYIYVWHKT
jgi:hypothetical protein